MITIHIEDNEPKHNTSINPNEINPNEMKLNIIEVDWGVFVIQLPSANINI